MRLYNATVEITDRLTGLFDIYQTTILAKNAHVAESLAIARAEREGYILVAGDCQPHQISVWARAYRV